MPRSELNDAVIGRGRVYSCAVHGLYGHTAGPLHGQTDHRSDGRTDGRPPGEPADAVTG